MILNFILSNITYICAFASVYIVVFYYIHCMVQLEQHYPMELCRQKTPFTTHFLSVPCLYAITQSCVCFYVSANFHNEILISLEGKI